MKQFELDRNYFTQIGLDSGALTMLGAIVHSVNEPGEYRGTVRKDKQAEGTFYITADSNSPVAQVTIDLAALTEETPEPTDCCKDESKKNRFVVNPKGYALFRVSHGAGGYNVHLRRAAEEQETQVFNSSQLDDGDIFSGIIVRPGRYSLKNLLSKAEGEIVVSYPVIGKTGYRPPPPVTIECTREGFKQARVELQPGQGINFQIKTPSRLKIELVEPDNGPQGERQRYKRGYRKRSLRDISAKQSYSKQSC